MMSARKVAVVACLLLTASCADSRPVEHREVIGRWLSADGFEVRLADQSYEFCDGRKCHTGKLIRRGAENSVAIELEGIFDQSVSRRFKERLAAVRPDRKDIGSDLDFTVTGGYARTQWCEGCLCVLFGSVEDERHVVFFKMPSS
jgi:hypothetical protein